MLARCANGRRRPPRGRARAVGGREGVVACRHAGLPRRRRRVEGQGWGSRWNRNSAHCRGPPPAPPRASTELVRRIGGGCRAADERGTRLRLRFFGPKNIGTITDQCRRVCRKSRIFFAQARTSHRLLAPSPALPLLLSGPWSKRYQLECVEVKLGLEARVRGRGIWCEKGRYWPTMRCWGVRLRRG